LNEGAAEAEAEAPEPSRSWLGCGLRVALGIVAVFGLLMAATFLGSLIFGDTDLREEPSTLNAGTAEEYAPSDLTYFDLDHIYIVRKADGSFLALYDRSTRAQELDRDCRVRFDETLEPVPLEQLSGFRGAFVEDCDGGRTVWRVDGQLASGSGWANLDRLNTSVDADGNLIVDITQRTCTRSRGVVGVAPFDEQTCGRPS
jgi:hypothetical protein